MSTEVILITGSNRGIGLELARTFLERGHHVIATCRQPESAQALKALASTFPDALTVTGLDVSSPDSVAQAAAFLSKRFDRIDCLVNNAGVFPGEKIDEIEDVTEEQFKQAFNINVVGAFSVAKAFLPMLRLGAHPRVVNISSGAGSIGNKVDSLYYAYSISKAALNMLTRILAVDLRQYGICVVSLNPGWVRTEMGGADAEISADASAQSLATTIGKLRLDRSSRWLDRFGREVQNGW